MWRDRSLPVHSNSFATIRLNSYHSCSINRTRIDTDAKDFHESYRLTEEEIRIAENS